jgi:signal transduction histidine kinase
MPAAALPLDEAQRLAALRALEILDTPAEAALDDIVMLASQICGTPIALVSLVDADRQWFKAKVGMDASQTPRDQAFCAHAILGDAVLVVPDARADARFVDNPLVMSEPAIRFYAGAPIHLPDGSRAGTLCIIDHVPRELAPEAHAALLALTRQVEGYFTLRHEQLRLKQRNTELAQTQRRKDALVQFAAHDMKNALAVILTNADALADAALDGEALREIARELENAGLALKRLVFDMLDAISAERRGGIAVARTTIAVDLLIAKVIKALRRQASAAGIELRNPPNGIQASGDPALLARVLENLVDNAIRSSPRGSEIVISARSSGAQTTLVVADRGTGVEPGSEERIFELDAQGPDAAATSRGLGLAFCRLVAHAHGGRVWVEPNDGRGSLFSVTF